MQVKSKSLCESVLTSQLHDRVSSHLALSQPELDQVLIYSRKLLKSEFRHIVLSDYLPQNN